MKQNFHGRRKDVWCISFGLFPENQSHLLQCPALVTNLNYLCGKTSRINENFIYGNQKQQETIVNIFADILEVRENIEKQKRNTED